MSTTDSRSPRIVVIGSFDTKEAEYRYLCDMIKRQGGEVLTVNTGVLGSTTLFPVDIEAAEVADAAGGDLATLRTDRDRGAAIKVMAQGAAEIVRGLHVEGRVSGVIGMGGSGGTSVIAAAMRVLPVGIPKVCVSTVAGGDTAPYVGLKDITLIPSITDIAGLNRISRIILTRAAGAIVGMSQALVPEIEDDRPIIATSMFGNTTECVDRCRHMLNEAGYEVLVFHATGTGGRTMEALIDEGLIDACLDITTTEWADTICGGVFDAGKDRLSAAGRRGIPHLIVPGCIDMANFGPLDTVPSKYIEAKRRLYEWNPSVTLMRTNVEENRRMGQLFAEKANAAVGPVAFLLPLRGVSILDGDGQIFCDRDSDRAMFAALREHLRPGIPIEEVDANINDAVFAEKAVDMMVQLIEQSKLSQPKGTG